MQITEIFQSTTELKKLDAGRARSEYGLYDIVSLYGANIDGVDYIFYFDNCSGVEGEFGVGFGTLKDDQMQRVSHKLTKNTSSPTKVFAAAFQAIDNFIREHEPMSLSFTGASDRQQAFYGALANKLSSKVPAGYTLLKRNTKDNRGRIYLTRDPDKIEDRSGYTVIKESRIDELFDAPIPDYELETLSAEEVRTYFHLHDPIDTAYGFNILGEEFVILFAAIEGKRGWFDCSFAKAKPFGTGIRFDLTGTSRREQFKVFRMVFAGIQRFIAARKPLGIIAIGYTRRQSDFYAKLLKAYEHRLPKPYFWAMDGEKVLITRSKTVAPEREHLDRLKDEQPAQPVEEGASEDVMRVRVAERIVNKYIHWLAVANEEAPLEDIMERTFKWSKRENILFASGETIGLAKGFHDLNLGYAWPVEGAAPDNVRGWLSPLVHPMGGPRKYLACLVRETDPSKDTDLAYEMGYEAKSILVHEVTHYLDYKRSTVDPGSTQKLIKKHGKAAGYYNSPLEFNAFFQQGLHTILKDLKDHPIGTRFRKEDEFSTFEKFLANNLFQFNFEFRENLNPVYKKKLMRRLYKLYGLIKANPKDFDSVERVAKEFND